MTPKPLPPALQRQELEQSIAFAQRNISHWEGELVARIEAAQALDGMGGWMSKLLGTFDQDVDAAIEQVAIARAQRDQAETQLEAAKLALLEWTEAQSRAADDAVSQVLAVEEAVATAKAAGGPVAEALAEHEARLETLEARRDRLEAAHEASTDLVMALSRARATASQSRSRSVVLPYQSRPSAPPTTVEVQRSRAVEIHAVTEATLRWEDVLLALGTDEPPNLIAAAECAARVDGDYASGEDAELPIESAQAAVEPIARQVEKLLRTAALDVAEAERERALVVGIVLPDEPDHLVHQAHRG